MLEANDGLCSLCGEVCIRPSLDHAHIKFNNDPKKGGGQIRAPICAACNCRLGRVEEAWRCRIEHSELADWLRKAADYVDYHRENPSGIYHHKERSKMNNLVYS